MKRIKSIYFKNFLTMVTVLFLSFLILGTSFAALSYQFVMSDKTETMRSNADSARDLISAYSSIWSMDSIEVRTMLLWISETNGVHIVASDDTGTIVSCSDRRFICPHMGATIPEDVIGQMQKNGEYRGYGKLSGLYDAERYIVGVPLASDDGRGPIKGYLILSSETKQMQEMWRHFAAIFLVAAITVVLISFVMSFVTTKKQARPIKEMAEAVHKFGRGDFSVRVREMDRSDEIGELAYSFNRMADSLERAENTRRDLIANVSHELKTPMTTITGFADGILDGTVPPEREREYIALISSETKRLSRLVRGMLETSQLQSVDKEEIAQKSFDISEVIRVALISLEPKITARGLDVDARLPEEPVYTVGDVDAITQVVYNLTENAAKFANPGSEIRLELYKKAGKAYVSVENEGETISREELPLIFDRFHKTDRSRSMDRDGVGLGLYIVKTILESHGEDIFVTSKDGVTKFEFSLSLRGEG